MANQLTRRLAAIEARAQAAGRWLPGIRIIHDPEKGEPLGDYRVRAIWQEEMDRRIAAGEAQPGDHFPIVVRAIVHSTPREPGHGQA